MEKTRIIKLDTTQICNECGEKIGKGEYSVEVIGEGVYFCNTDCLTSKVDRQIAFQKKSCAPDSVAFDG